MTLPEGKYRKFFIEFSEERNKILYKQIPKPNLQKVNIERKNEYFLN